MGNVAAVEQLNSQIAKRLHDAKVTVDRPANPEGHWWIDVEHRGHAVSVEFRPGQGFGVSGPRGGYGEGPDVVVPSASAAADHVVAFLAASRLRGETPLTRDSLRAVVDALRNELGVVLQYGFENAEKELLKKLTAVSKDVKKLEAEVSVLTTALLGSARRRPAKPAPKTARKRKTKSQSLGR